MLKKISLLLPILPKLGYRNVAYMVWYRLSMKLGWRKRKFPLGTSITGTFFKATAPMDNYPESWKSKTLEKANRILEGKLTWFHYHSFQVGNPPNWFLNPFDGSALNNPKKHWTTLSDFELNTGDIKILWESSRFDWLTDLARGYRVTGEEKYIKTLNQWLQDWSQHNPKNQGPNWKCGQETAIRVMKLITTSQILEQDTNATKALQHMVYEHLERIAGNINYAIAQDNNHGTSEAAGLYISATWLLNQKNKEVSYSKLRQWKKRGRNLLENRVLKLIAPHGTFSQRSVTYHRVVVDTMSWVLYAMERYKETPFNEKVTERLLRLGEWQYKMIASKDGDMPNIGSNDGAMFETLHNNDYRDFRPSTQLFFGVLKKQKVFKDVNCDEPLYWRYPNLYKEFSFKTLQSPKIELLDNEFLIIRDSGTKIFLKILSDRSRPSACDALHIDVWYKGINILGDTGSYSYNAGEETVWFKSVEAHNTVQFDNNQQMPKISRFLFGNWVKAEDIQLQNNDDKVVFLTSYKDYRGNVHKRKMEYKFKKHQLSVIDELKQSKGNSAFCRWHMTSECFSKNENGIIFNDIATMKIENFDKAQLMSQYASLYYMEKHETTCVKVPFKNNVLTSTIKFL